MILSPFQILINMGSTSRPCFPSLHKLPPAFFNARRIDSALIQAADKRFYGQHLVGDGKLVRIKRQLRNGLLFNAGRRTVRGFFFRNLRLGFCCGHMLWDLFGCFDHIHCVCAYFRNRCLSELIQYIGLILLKVVLPGQQPQVRRLSKSFRVMASLLFSCSMCASLTLKLLQNHKPLPLIAIQADQYMHRISYFQHFRHVLLPVNQVPLIKSIVSSLVFFIFQVSISGRPYP